MADIAKVGSGTSINHQENVTKTTRKRSCANHCKRFWWVWLIIVGCIIALVVPLIIFVAVPKIAQDKINQAQLEVTGISVSNSQSQNFTMGISSIIRTDGSVHAQIDAFEGDMFLTDLPQRRPFVRVKFPATDSSAYQEVKVDQFTPITDMEAFTTFNTWLMANESLRVTVEGTTFVQVRGLSNKYSVKFSKIVTMPGIRNFEGITVQNTTVTPAPDARGDNFKGTTTIPNRSLVTFEIGNSSFHTYLEDKEVGTVFIDNLVLRPGLNNFPIRASLQADPVVASVRKEPFCHAGIVPFKLRGKTIVNNGQPLSYFADALASANQTVMLDLRTPLSALGVNTTCGSGH